MTNQALACISSGRETVFNAGKKALASMGRGRGAGNGSLMRCVATGLAHPREEIDTITKESRIISEITHADKSCVASCIAYNIILSNIMADEKDIETCIDSTAQLVDTINQDTSDIMMNALSGKLRFVAGEMTQTGYVLRAFERALTSLLHGTSFEDEMVKVINEGGDADTNGAIAGGLLGAKYGYDAIPDRWIRDLKHKDELDEAVDIICKFRGI
jgi:ADP-ribosylglycohydrolase